jgi:hypothetical protein
MLPHAYRLWAIFLWVNQAPAAPPSPEAKSHEVAAAVIGAIVGALLAGWLTYVALQSAEESKQKKLVLRLCSLILLELAGHQPILTLELDEFLPTWLNRRESDFSGPNALKSYPPAWQSLRLTRLPDQYYSRFFTELIHSDLVIEFESYYDDVRVRNQMIEEWHPEQAKDQGIAYATCTIRILRMGIDIISKIRKVSGISRHFVEAEATVLDNFDSQALRSSYLLTLSGLKLGDLDNLSLAEEWEAEDPKELGRLGGRPPKLDKIPEIIRNDPTKLWKQYLKRAKEMPRPRL